MNDIDISIVTRGDDLPDTEALDFFHSNSLFLMVERAPGQTPYLVVARRGGSVVGRMLVVMRRRGALIPPYLFTQGRVYGEGEYADGEDREELFSMMLSCVTRRLIWRLCLYIEFSHTSSKMFGYGKFRENHFFPLRWVRVRNSLHSMDPEARLNDRVARHLAAAERSSVTTSATESREDFLAFHRMLSHRITLKVRRYVPAASFFEELIQGGHARLFLTRERDRMMGGCVCVYDVRDCYMWYVVRRKGLHRKRCLASMAWAAIKDAHAMGCRHISFADVGLPLRNNAFRDYILNFGGQSTGTYRWFRCSIGWVNRLLSWLYRE